MKVLIVDDVDYIRKSITKVLEGRGFECQSCENGRKAADCVDQESYDLIITDMMMPDMDGFEFIEHLQNLPNESAKTPVLAISGGNKLVNSDTALKVVEEKSVSVLHKPFSKTDLLDMVADIVGPSAAPSSTMH